MCPQLIGAHFDSLAEHKKNLAEAKKEAEEDCKDLYDKEMALVDRALSAPTHPIEINFKKENIKSLSAAEKQKPLALGAG